jgi:multidrug efflux system membrane fusion protein
LGRVEAAEVVPILPQVSGRITSIDLEEGARVERGQKLLSIDTRPYAASLAAARAELQRSQALSEQAAREAERYDGLAREGVVSGLEAAQRRSDRQSLSASVAAARAQIDSARLNVQLSEIRAPISGKAGAISVRVGEVVREGDPAPLLVLRSLSPVKVGFTIAQDLATRLRQRVRSGAVPVRATPREAGAQTTVGEVTFIDNSIDPATGSLLLKATFDNTDEALWPGAFVDVVLVLDVDKQAVIAPEAAVAEGQQGAHAFVVDDKDIAHLRRVVIGRRTETLVIIEQGLAPGDRVVIDGLVRLKEGSAVTVKPAAPPAGPNARGTDS